MAKREHFLLKAADVQINNVDRDNLDARRGQPAASGGARNPSPSRVSDVTDRSDKIAKSMVISLLNESRGRHAAMIATTVGTENADCATPTQVRLPPFTSPEHVSTGENSRTKL
ncbi:MAG: hypothetical protein CMJ18_23610 [Phycisphaeraceae bacterium]|nr:hypothetical protein [Phycisphaeraceae bacterium]